MKNPPAGIKLVMEAVCVLKGIKPERITTGDGKKINDYWKPSLKMLADTRFLETLINFDKVPELNYLASCLHNITSKAAYIRLTRDVSVQYSITKCLQCRIFQSPRPLQLQAQTLLSTTIMTTQDNIPADIMKNLRNTYLTNPDFDPEKIKYISGACEGLCRWMLAIEKYDVCVCIIPISNYHIVQLLCTHSNIPLSARKILKKLIF